ncbi:hypothetical protein [Streptomyces spiramenti]|uniref:Uncharacterized protein n=1 Tax=Streptomyces spiramenti TaxID=2720606 RepID=A0ABX1ALC8_9ACTN|nr:hypothetical protein [Streptomyces spiramenti]NJP66506.1 hypothetical protein [Streptomyces spiramenti]
MLTASQVVDRADTYGVMPLLTLAEFFDGNEQEQSIAPNQWGYGRPPLAELAEAARGVEAMPEVAWVRVQLHSETLTSGELAGEALAVCTTATESEVERWIAGWESGGPVAGLVDTYAEVPGVPPGARIWSVVWD